MQDDCFLVSFLKNSRTGWVQYSFGMLRKVAAVHQAVHRIHTKMRKADSQSILVAENYTNPVCLDWLLCYNLDFLDLCASEISLSLTMKK